MIGLIFCYLQKKQEYHTNISTLTQIGKSAHFTLFGFNFCAQENLLCFESAFICEFYLFYLQCNSFLCFQWKIQYYQCSQYGLVLLEMDPPSLSATPTLLAIPILVKNGKPVVLPSSSTDISIRKTTEEITKAFLLYYLNDMSDKLN